MKRGFTITELTIVLAVIAIISTIAVLGVTQFRQRAQDTKVKSTVAILKDAAEQYYNQNHEYPTADQLFGGTPTLNPPSDLQTAATLLKVPLAMLTSNDTRFAPCSNTINSSTNTCTDDFFLQRKQYIQYMTKAAGQASTTGLVWVTTPYGRTGGLYSCSVLFGQNEDAGAGFILTYWSEQDYVVKIVKSNRGTFGVSNSGPCRFTTVL